MPFSNERKQGGESQAVMAGIALERHMLIGEALQRVNIAMSAMRVFDGMHDTSTLTREEAPSVVIVGGRTDATLAALSAKAAQYARSSDSYGVRENDLAA